MWISLCCNLPFSDKFSKLPQPTIRPEDDDPKAKPEMDTYTKPIRTNPRLHLSSQQPLAPDPIQIATEPLSLLTLPKLDALGVLNSFGGNRLLRIGSERGKCAVEGHGTPSLPCDRHLGLSQRCGLNKVAVGIAFASTQNVFNLRRFEIVHDE